MHNNSSYFNEKNFEQSKEPIGSGSYSNVYLFTEKNTEKKKKYAGKVLKSDIISVMPRSIEREIAILEKIKHPAIVGYYGMMYKNDQVFMMTEYIENISLFIKKDPVSKKREVVDLSEKNKKIILIGISRGMKYLHDHGIMHRDLKCENILIDSEMHPKICDFGLSRCFPNPLLNSDDVYATSYIGSIAYMAPELLSKKESYSCSVDVYSFGIIAYEIVFGKIAYPEDSPRKDVIKGERPDFPQDCKNEKMKELIVACWQPDPKNRPSFDEIFKKLAYEKQYFDLEKNDEAEVEAYIDYLLNIEYKEISNEKKIEIDNYEKMHKYEFNIIKTLLDSKFFISYVQISDMPIIDYACSTGNIDLVKYLINERGIEVNQKHLESACSSGNLELVRYLIEKRKLNADKSLLKHVCYSGSIDLVNYILDTCKINFKEVKTLSIFEYACYSKNLKFFKHLFAMIDVNGDGHIEGEETILHTACSVGNLEYVIFLIEEKKMPWDAKGKNNMTILHCACGSGNEDLVIYLFGNGRHFEISDLTTEGANALHYAARSGNKWILKYLEPKFTYDDKIKETNNGMTILHFACQSGNFELVKYILKDLLFPIEKVKVKNINNETALDIAKKNHFKDIVKIVKDKLENRPIS
ncbi:hypothetical protein M9Y10_040222 [Tritrichomonas musculus]|uniref:Protein kinase domain-containing protein n=1 Tax=Tritrichomonas musculus TaxID=1915356 RepID=A0ABR2GR16_9EUKA